MALPSRRAPPRLLFVATFESSCRKCIEIPRGARSGHAAAGATMRLHARGIMHASCGGGASLAALVLVCAKTALFTHYGLLSLRGAPAPKELLGVATRVGDGKGRPGGGGGAGATSFLSWVEKGFEDIGGDLYSLGPNGGADSARRAAGGRERGRLSAEASAATADAAIVTGASVVQLKHSLHREMMQPAPSAKPRTAPANRGGSLGKAYTPPANRHGESLEAREAAVGKAAARVAAVPDDECGQSGFTCAELHAAEKAEKATEAKLPALPLPPVNGILN